MFREQKTEGYIESKGQKGIQEAKTEGYIVSKGQKGIPKAKDRRVFREQKTEGYIESKGQGATSGRDLLRHRAVECSPETLCV